MSKLVIRSYVESGKITEWHLTMKEGKMMSSIEHATSVKTISVDEVCQYGYIFK